MRWPDPEDSTRMKQGNQGLEGNAGPVILVVDDQQSNVRMVGGLLVKSGYQVLQALGGAEGLALAREHKPDVVLLDMKMPGMDGFDVLGQLREDPDIADLPVIFLTADSDRENLVRAFAAGAMDYITKPFVSEELLARVNTHVALKRSRDALRRFAHEKQEMAELVAHDLRNYLANILFATELLKSGHGLGSGQDTLVDSIRTSADSGMLFLQALLEQQEDQAHGAVVEPLPVRQLLREVIDLLGRSASLKNISLDLLESETVVVSGMRTGVGHVLQNLVSNAIKYSPPATCVDISAYRHGKCGRVLVMDRGPGICEKDQAHLFQRFARLSSEPTQGESSTGLGLALAKQQARAMGGNLWYEQREGGGSIFTLELPLA